MEKKFDSISSETIKEAVSFAENEMSMADEKEKLKCLLTLEEVLLVYSDELGDVACDTRFKISVIKVPGFNKVALTVNTGEMSPFENYEEMSIMGALLTGYTSSTPVWKYSDGKNVISFSVHKKRAKVGVLGRILIALPIGIVLGLLARHFLSDDVRSVIINDYARPLGNAYVGIFCVMAILLTFLAMTLSIANAGNVSNVSKQGGRVIARMYIIVAAVSLGGIVVLLPFANFSRASADSIDVKLIFDQIVGMVPTDLVSPFLNFNSIQIIIIGIMFGFAMLVLGHRTDKMKTVFEECNLVAISCNNFLNKALIHVYVGIEVFCISSSPRLNELEPALETCAVILGSFALLVIAYTIAVRLKTKCSLKVWIRKTAPTFLINLSSASYGASYTTSIESMIGPAGVEVPYASLFHNVGGVLFKPAFGLLYIVTSVYALDAYDMTVSISWVIVAFMLSLIISSTIPTIPGGAISGFVLLFPQLGLPTEALATIIALNAFLDFFSVAVNGYCLQCEMVISAQALGHIDLEQLRK